MKVGYVEFSVYLACLSSVFNLYSNLIIVFGFLGHMLWFSIVSAVLFGVLIKFHIPRPSESSIRSILGREWGAYASSRSDSQNDDNVMKVVAHRACGLDAPENSISALKKVTDEGILAVEFDVMLTSDHIPVVFHDSSLFRMANVNDSVEAMKYEDVKKYDISVKHPFGKNFPGERIPSLDEFVSLCLEKNIKMFIDLKSGQRRLCRIINNLFKRYPALYDNAVVSSFNPIHIYRIRANDPKIACSLAWRPYFYSHEDYNGLKGPVNPRTASLPCLLYLRLLNNLHEWALWSFGYYLLGLSALLLHKDMITRNIINYWKKRGIRVIAWSVNLPSEKRYFEKVFQITYLTDTVICS